MDQEKKVTPPWAAKPLIDQAPETSQVGQLNETATSTGVEVPPAVETATSTSPTVLPKPENTIEGKVTVTSPKAFKLRVDNHVTVDYKAGVQEMPVSHAEHWYSKANGVVVYKP